MIVDGQVSVITLYPEEEKRILTIEINGDTSLALNNAQNQELYANGLKSAELYLPKNYPTTA